jgi:transporter, major facilitator family
MALFNTVNKFKTLIKAQPIFAKLSLIQLICYFGMWFSHTGIFTLLIELDAPIWAITLSAAMAFIPGVIMAPFSGIVVDSFNPKPLLLLLTFIEMVTLVILIFINDISLLWLLFVIIFTRMGAGGIYFQAEMSLMPKILNKDELKIANELHSLIWAFSYTAGMGLAGIYIHYFGIDSAFLLDFFLYSIAFYILIKTKISINIQKSDQNITQMLKDGLIYIKSNPLIAHLIALHAVVGITSYDALVALLADYPYAGLLSASLVIGYINACRAIALGLGPIVLSKFVNSNNLWIIYMGQGLGIIIWAITQFNFYLGFLGVFCAGFFTSSLWSYTYTLLQQKCDEKFYGRIIAYNDMFYLGVSALISVSIGALFELGLSLMMITIIMGCMFFIGAIYWQIVYNKYKIWLN